MHCLHPGPKHRLGGSRLRTPAVIVSLDAGDGGGDEGPPNAPAALTGVHVTATALVPRCPCASDVFSAEEIRGERLSVAGFSGSCSLLVTD